MNGKRVAVVHVNNISTLYGTPSELYTRMEEAGYFLPPKQHVQYPFLVAICEGTKKFIKGSTEHVPVKRVEGLRITDLLDFAKRHKLMDYMPDPDKGHVSAIQKDWLASVLNHLKPVEFKKLKLQCYEESDSKFKERAPQDVLIIEQVLKDLSSVQMEPRNPGKKPHWAKHGYGQTKKRAEKEREKRLSRENSRKEADEMTEMRTMIANLKKELKEVTVQSEQLKRTQSKDSARQSFATPPSAFISPPQSDTTTASGTTLVQKGRDGSKVQPFALHAKHSK